MKNLLLILGLALVAWGAPEGRLFYAKLEPKEHYILKAATSGLVVESRRELEGSFISAREGIVRLDDRLDRELLRLEEENLTHLKERASALQAIAQMKERTFLDSQGLKSKSKLQKESEEMAALSAKVSYLQALEQAHTLEGQIAQRRDVIAKKHLNVENRYLYKVHVRAGDYVNAGAILAEVMDISEARVVFFLSGSELKSLEDKVIYIDGAPSEARVEKRYKVADSDYLSEYRIEAILPARGTFSQLVKIELKDKK